MAPDDNTLIEWALSKDNTRSVDHVDHGNVQCWSETRIVFLLICVEECSPYLPNAAFDTFVFPSVWCYRTTLTYYKKKVNNEPVLLTHVDQIDCARRPRPLQNAISPHAYLSNRIAVRGQVFQ